MRTRAALSLALCLAAGAVGAQEGQAGTAVPPACMDFAWPLLREQAWFAAPGLAEVASGATVQADMPGAVLRLKPDAEVQYTVPPSRTPAPGSYGGGLRFPAPVMAGIFQVTLSGEAWIDVSQDGETTKTPVAHTGARGCPTIRKSLRYQFGGSPVIIEISGAKRDSIKIAIAPVE
ncbi:hypothetical protein [Methylobacterium nigriterrae]|uniref:hypothetical protein n=1 Tax=Methylobacterium nigriterrae TaxID=3127512 RepID=UPI003013B76B